jgi:hypothetical protein
MTRLVLKIANYAVGLGDLCGIETPIYSAIERRRKPKDELRAFSVRPGTFLEPRKTFSSVASLGIGQRVLVNA